MTIYTVYFTPSIDIFTTSLNISIISKMEEYAIRLGSIISVLNGIATHSNMEGILDRCVNKNSKPILFGKDISRYYYKHSGKHVNYMRDKLLRARDENIFLCSEKLVMQRIGGILITAYDDQKYYTFNSVNNLLLKDNVGYNIKYILGFINSKLMRFYYITRFTNKSLLTVNISKTFLDHLPIPYIDFNDAKAIKSHDKMVKLVETMLGLQKKLAAAKVPDEKTRVQRQIDSTDRQIDKLVYELYGLTEEEIEIVENE